MTRLLMIAAAAALTVPAVATATARAEDAQPATMPAVAIAAGAASATIASARPQRYCIVGIPTGTRLPQRDCRSLDAWLATGFDPRKPN